jgi:hypothetical protein
MRVCRRSRLSTRKRLCTIGKRVLDCGHHLAREGDPGSNTRLLKGCCASPQPLSWQGETQNYLPRFRVQRGLESQSSSIGHDVIVALCNVRVKIRIVSLKRILTRPLSDARDFVAYCCLSSEGRRSIGTILKRAL